MLQFGDLKKKFAIFWKNIALYVFLKTIAAYQLIVIGHWSVNL